MGKGRQLWKIALATVVLAIALLVYAGRKGPAADAWWWSAAGAIANVVAGLFGDEPAGEGDEPQPGSLAEAIEGAAPTGEEAEADEEAKPGADSLVDAVRAAREPAADR